MAYTLKYIIFCNFYLNIDLCFFQMLEFHLAMYVFYNAITFFIFEQHITYICVWMSLTQQRCGCHFTEIIFAIKSPTLERFVFVNTRGSQLIMNRFNPGCKINSRHISLHQV